MANWTLDSIGEWISQTKFSLVLPWASEAELQRAQLIASAVSNATVLPKLTIDQLATVISQAQTAVGVDTVYHTWPLRLASQP